MVLIFHYSHFFYPVGSREPMVGYKYREPLSGPLRFIYEHGDLAVPIFWMMSGLVLASVYAGGKAATRDFALNRVARLYPLHLFTLLAVAVLQMAAVNRWGVTLLYDGNDLPHFLGQLLFVSNWLEGSAPSFNGPIWSVSAEILIYGLFWLVHAWLPRQGVIRPLLLSMACAAVAELVAASPVARCGFYFFFGCALHAAYVALLTQRRLLVAGASAMALIGAAALGTSGATVQMAVGVPLAFGGLIVLLIVAETMVTARWRRSLQLIGDNSYSMYLWHVPIQLSVFLLLPDGLVAEVAASPWFLLTFVLVVTVVARLSFVWIERPARQWLRRATRQSPALPLCAAASPSARP